ncbi:MAG: protein-glutamine glutaminase family protein [Bdellovibrio sp.]
MRLISLLLASCVLSLNALAITPPGLSSVRLKNESYEQARTRAYTKTTDITVASADSAESSKKPLSELDLQEIPELASYEELEEQFIFLRDTRFIETSDPNFPRRLTWLYPDDGCYARAEMMKIQLASRSITAPKKVFVFGDLYAKSKNAPSGYVQWWYHVAVTYRVADQAYVIDPSVEPHRPLKITEWNTLVGGERKPVQYALCSENTFDPSQDCQHPRAMSRHDSLSIQKSFLKTEWYRIVSLKRSPEKELGDSPPWLDH